MSNRLFNGCKLFIYAFLFVSVIAPLFALLGNISVGDIQSIISTPSFAPMLVNSLVTTSIATLLSVSLALILSFLINRSKIRFKQVFPMLFTLPMLIPSISCGTGLVLLLGDNGLLTNLFGINIGLYGYKGIVLGSILYSFPMAFLMLNDAFKYEDETMYEAARVLGLNKWQQFKVVTLPNISNALISVIFATFTMIFTDYGVPLVVGGKVMTLPVYMYREVVGLLDFSKGAILSLILLIPAIIAFIIDLNKDNNSKISSVVKPVKIEVNKARDIFVYILCGFTVFLISLPLLAFLYLSFVKQYPIDLSFTFDNIKQAFNLGAALYLKNSITIALLTSLIGIAVIYFTAYLTARSKQKFSSLVLHLISLATLAIPGIVLGLCYVLFFNGSPIYGTLIIIVLVNIVHFFASPYLMAYNSLSQMSESFEDLATVLGISKFKMIKDVFIPNTYETLVEMFSYLFVNAMVTISAVSFLANFKNMPLALLIPQFDSQSLIEATAFISIIILVVNGLVKIGCYLVKRFVLNK